jgi:3-hydroxybutyryl-CoA dehydratase
MSIEAGDLLPSWTVESVDPEKMKIMAALLRDPNPIHLDPAAARALGLGDRVVNQGPVNFGYVQNMLAAWAGGPGRIRAISLRLTAIVLAGDRVAAGGRVTSVSSGGVVECAVWLDVLERAGSPLRPPLRALAGTATVVPPDDGLSG